MIEDNFRPTSDNKCICLICNNEFSKFGIKQHIEITHLKTRKAPKEGKIAWNKGLSKENDIRVAKQSDTLKNNIDSGKVIHYQTGKPLTIEAKEKMSNTIKTKIQNNEWHLSFSKSRTHVYKNVNFLGTWEMKFAMWLDDNNVKWKRVTKYFNYTFNGLKKRYLPDFYLPEFDIYIEVKGYPTEKDFAKWNDFQHSLCILSGPLLKDLGIDIEYKDQKIVYKNVKWY